MEIFTLLEELEDILESCKTVPFSGKSVVDKEEILEIIKEIRCMPVTTYYSFSSFI